MKDNMRKGLDAQQPILNVAPLNSVPYTGPPSQSDTYNSVPSVRSHSPPKRNSPAMVFLPSHSSEKEWADLMAVAKDAVCVSGCAALGKVGPTLGSLDIAESDYSYFFRISLPGVAREEKEFTCDIKANGKVILGGKTTTGEKKVRKHNMVFEMKSQNLCPTGKFSISFKLPGPVDPDGCKALFGIDGIFECVVKKSLAESV